ncbi:tRNA uridine-5-carboxymethylaminomethyl(34) synthesis GTPase MnmE [candidate division KSB1 bacterium]|nr:tRNA uridine-5-carboxymethylaminomethyl(34) synthesis GTPase MnmE [candidate division KSB1 bacterium]
MYFRMIGSTQDTICAVSTPQGRGAIAIIRMSGRLSFDIIERIFSAKKSIHDIAHGCMTHGTLFRRQQEREVIDNVLIAKFVSPRSYTGEDTIEINCHGGIYVVQEILHCLLENGARLAEPGEFTKRAFLNGKIDLLQAESIADIINAQTKLSLKSAQQQLSGNVSDKLLSLKEQLKKYLALLEIELDFAEEDIEFAARSELMTYIDSMKDEFERLIVSFRYGKILREGLHLALAGKPNVGKSSILNRLLEEERAIVSEIPGTTRDVIEEALDIQGMLFKISDTAGIRLTDDSIEIKGVEKTQKALRQADQVLFVVDASHALDDSDYIVLQQLESLQVSNIVLVMNKIDIDSTHVDLDFVKKFEQSCFISAKTGEGFEAFKEKLVTSNLNHNIFDGGIVFNKVRHLNALKKSKESILHARESLEKKLSAEFIALDIRAALETLAEITGEVTTEEILNDIFSSFCIGK